MGIPVNDGLLQIFDVEHGACALLTVCDPVRGFKRLMIDCGHNASMPWYPGRHLRDLGVTVLDELIITNYDEDHVSGYPDLLAQGITVEWLIRNPSVSPNDIRKLKSETGIGAGMNKFISELPNFGTPPGPGVPPPALYGTHIDWFWNPYSRFDDENNLSLAVFLTIHGFTFLFTGDLEREGFEHMLETSARFRELLPSVTVLMASHHGRENGICPDIFDVWGCKPKIVVISDDYKQYDTQETVSYYGSKCAGITDFRMPGNSRKVLTTRNDGEIQFLFANGACNVM